MPLEWKMGGDGAMLLRVGDTASHVVFKPMAGVTPDTINVEWMFSADADGKLPIDDAQLQLVVNLNAQSDGGERLSKRISFAPYEQRLLSDMIQEAFEGKVSQNLELTVRVDAPGVDTIVRPDSLQCHLHVVWSSPYGPGKESACWQCRWPEGRQQGASRAYALGFDMGTSADGVAALVRRSGSTTNPDDPGGELFNVMYLLEDARKDEAGLLRFIGRENVHDGLQNPDSDIIVQKPWADFPDRELAVTVPEHNAAIVESVYGNPWDFDMSLFRRLKACAHMFDPGTKLKNQWPFCELPVANMINRVRHAAPLAPFTLDPDVRPFLTYSFSFPAQSVVELAERVRRFCGASRPTAGLPEGQATGLGVLARAVHEFCSGGPQGETDANAIRKALCELVGLPPGSYKTLDKVHIVAHDVGDGTAEACLQIMEIGDDPEKQLGNAPGGALVKSTAQSYWAESFGGGGRITVLVRTLFVLRLLLRIFGESEDAGEFWSKLQTLIQGWGLGGHGDDGDDRSAFPLNLAQTQSVWPLIMVLAERTLAGDPEIAVSPVPNVDYFARLANKRGDFVQSETEQFITYALSMPKDADSLRKFLRRYAEESPLGQSREPAYVAAARKLLDDDAAQTAVGQARESLQWMINTLFNFKAYDRDGTLCRDFRQSFRMALWEIAEQYKCQFPRRNIAPDDGSAIIHEGIMDDTMRAPDWQIQDMGSREAFVAGLPENRWFLFDNLLRQFQTAYGPGMAILNALPEEWQNKLGGDRTQFQNALIELLAIPPRALFRHTIVPTYVMLHNAFGLFHDMDKGRVEKGVKLFVPSGRGTAFAVYQYLLRTYRVAHYGAHTLLSIFGGQNGMGDPPLVADWSHDPVRLKHAQVDGAISEFLGMSEGITVRVESKTEPQPYFPYNVELVQGDSLEDATRETVLPDGPWPEADSAEYKSQRGSVRTAAGGNRRLCLVAGHEARVDTSMSFYSDLLPAPNVGPLDLSVMARRETPECNGVGADSEESLRIIKAYRDLIPPPITVLSNVAGVAGDPQEWRFHLFKEITLPKIYMDDASALLR
jgi:hypothetical protein